MAKAKEGYDRWDTPPKLPINMSKPTAAQRKKIERINAQLAKKNKDKKK